MTNEERFNSYLIPGRTELDCVRWKGAHDNQGYPLFWWNGKTRKAMKFLWELKKGESGFDKYLCHKCDNAWCLLEDHIYHGTARSNARDKVLSGNMPGAKLDEYKIKLIRGLLKSKRSNVSVRSWARIVAPLFNVSEHTLRAVATGQTWNWI